MGHTYPFLGMVKTLVPREGRISPYIERIPQPNVNYIKEDLGVYSIFSYEDNITLE
jgi:hypothetical protein